MFAHAHYFTCFVTLLTKTCNKYRPINKERQNKITHDASIFFTLLDAADGGV